MIRSPSTSSSSHDLSRGQARASASWAISTVSPSLLRSRALTRLSMTASCSSSEATDRRGARVRTGSPESLGVTSRSIRSRSISRWRAVIPLNTVSADWDTASWIPPVPV